jgi:hypothetical protein
MGAMGRDVGDDQKAQEVEEEEEDENEEDVVGDADLNEALEQEVAARMSKATELKNV